MDSFVIEGGHRLQNAQQIDRGYERIDQRPRGLGARIERVSGTFS